MDDVLHADARTDVRDRAPGVVLVHGIRTSRTMWRVQREALEAAQIPVRVVDLPGHGRRLAEEFTVEACMRAIDEAVDDVGGSAVLVGLSLGGYLSIEYARRRPGKVRVLLAAACCTSPRSVLRAGWEAVARGIERSSDSGERLNAFMVRRTLTEDAARDVAAGGFALTVMSPALAAVAALDPVAALRESRCPVWLVNGRFDHFRTQERRYLRAARSSGQEVRLVVVHGAKHLVSLDAPVAFTRLVLEAVERARTLDASVDQVPGARPSDERG